MTPKKSTHGQQVNKIGLQHTMLFLGMVVVLFLFFQLTVIPNFFAQFVVPLFKPSDEKMDKIGFVQFSGTVYASVPKDKEALLTGKNVEISKDLINREYIFDFSSKSRELDVDGYSKKSNEWYVRAEALGENAIILEPWIGATILAIDLSLLFSALFSILLPTRIGLVSALFDRQIDETKDKIRLQTGFSPGIVELLTLPDDKLAEKEYADVRSEFRTIFNRTFLEISENKLDRYEDYITEGDDIVKFRNHFLYERIKEFFSDFTVRQITDTKNALLWRRNHFKIFAGLRLYMSHHVTEKYQNFVTGLAYGGAAFLIVAVGIRGLKFIPAAKPSFILLAIFLEFTMLSLLAYTLIYTQEEERTDKMLKKMEDANRSQLDALRGQQSDIHQLANALVGQTAEIIKNRVEVAIEKYMTSDDKVQQVIASEIANKIIFGLRETENKK
ncbi:MAG: hypothetical protein A2X64_02275 [Ignavibacteria bacterium GWF2_33_9]|nr:MAG: hypothetical protein A2X64_02275 [Ignavibacteria bacterium GWF2_33_9]